MILSDRTLRGYLEGDRPVIEPVELWQIQPSSVDLRLADDWLDPATGEKGAFPRQLEWGDFLLGSTVETVNIPPHLLGVLDGKSSLGRCGLAVHITAGYIDPGFQGQITLELAVVGRHSRVVLLPGQAIAQLTLVRLDAPAERPYGSSPALGSHYQHQHGPTRSYLDEEGR